MKKIVSIFILLTLILTGCSGNKSTDSEYEKNMQEAVDCVSEEKYDDAISYLEKALKVEADDKEAKGLIEQLELLKGVCQETDNIDTLKSYLKDIDKIEQITTTSNAVKDKAKDKIDEIKQFIADKTNELDTEKNPDSNKTNDSKTSDGDKTSNDNKTNDGKTSDENKASDKDDDDIIEKNEAPKELG